MSLDAEVVRIVRFGDDERLPARHTYGGPRRSPEATVVRRRRRDEVGASSGIAGRGAKRQVMGGRVPSLIRSIVGLNVVICIPQVTQETFSTPPDRQACSDRTSSRWPVRPSPGSTAGPFQTCR